jgi:P-type Na+/K+ transporter
LDGLSSADAKRRQEIYGTNDLADADGVQPIKIVVAQVANAMAMVRIALGS